MTASRSELFKCHVAGLILVVCSHTETSGVARWVAIDPMSERPIAKNADIALGLSASNRRFTQGPGAPTPVGSRRGAGDLHSGLPPCDDLGICDLQLGAEGDFTQTCPATEGQWVSLAFPVETDGKAIGAVHITHKTNMAGGDLYLINDCGGNPDVGAILYAGCGDIAAGQTGPQVYPIDPPVTTGATTWVVAVFNSNFSFDVAYTSTVPDESGTATRLAYGNLGGSGKPGSWDDLSSILLGYCYCVSVGTVARPPEACCHAINCDADANGDGAVDPLDIGFIQARFATNPLVDDNCQADVNCDGQIDPLDSGYTQARFNSCDPPQFCAPGGAECIPYGIPPPVNDKCADAITLSTGTTDFSTLGAAKDGPKDCDPYTGRADIWYRYTPTANGLILVTQCGSATDYDSTLSAYAGSTCPVGSALACGDDECGVSSGAAEIVVPVTANQPIRIRVGGWDDGSCGVIPSGSGSFTLTFVPSNQGACCLTDGSCKHDTSAGCLLSLGTFQGEGTACTIDQCGGSPNDDCQDVTPVPLAAGQTVTFNGNNIGATSDCPELGFAEVWEAFTLTSTLDITLDYCGTPALFTPVSLFIDDHCPCDGTFVEADAPNIILCSMLDFNVELTFLNLPAGTYYIPIYAALDGLQGPYTLNLAAANP